MKFFSLLLSLAISATAMADGRITNADIYSAAGILTTKLAAKTANNVCTFDGSGFIGTGVAPGTSGNVLTSNGTVWTSSPTTAALSIGALDAQAANANGLALVSNVLSTQSADATHPGVVNNTTQTLSGAKTFSSAVTTGVNFIAPAATATNPSISIPTGGGNAGLYFGASGATLAYNTADVASFVVNFWKFNVQTQISFNSSANTPSLIFTTDTHTGLYRIGTNNWGWSANSTKILDMSTTGLGITGDLSVSGTTTLNTGLTGVTRAASGVISASELSGDITTSGSNVTTLKNTGAGAGSCTNCSVTFDAQGRETAYSSGTAPVTSLTVASANGFAGSFSASTTPVLTLSTTITGILSGNGTAISAASTTGSGNVVLATSPTITTPTIAKLANLTTNGIVYTTGSDGTLNSGPLTGDITTSGAAATLATVNSNVGSFTNANITVNAKGLVTAAANGSGGAANFGAGLYKGIIDSASTSVGWTITGSTIATLTNNGSPGLTTIGTPVGFTSCGLPVVGTGQPGVTCVPPNTGTVKCTVSFFWATGTGTGDNQFQLNDASNNILDAMDQYSISSGVGGFTTLTGLLDVTAGNAFVCKVRAGTFTAGTLYVGGSYDTHINNALSVTVEYVK